MIRIGHGYRIHQSRSGDVHITDDKGVYVFRHWVPTGDDDEEAQAANFTQMALMIARLYDLAL